MASRTEIPVVLHPLGRPELPHGSGPLAALQEVAQRRQPVGQLGEVGRGNHHHGVPGPRDQVRDWAASAAGPGQPPTSRRCLP